MSGVIEFRAKRTAKVDFCCVGRTRRERCEVLNSEICRIFTVLSQVLLGDGVGIRQPRDVLRSRRQRGKASEGYGPHFGRSCGGWRRDTRAEMEPKRESNEAKEVDLRCVDVCVGRRYEAAGQDMNEWGNGQTKAYTRCIPPPLNEPHPWIWQWCLADPLWMALQIPSGQTTGTAIMHDGRLEGWGPRVVTQGQLRARDGFWEV